MVTFAKADRRSSSRSKEVLSAREAAVIYLKAKEKSQIDENQAGHLLRSELETLIGRDWGKKLQKYITGGAGDVVIFNTSPLIELAASPVIAVEMAAMVTRHFTGAGRALDFIRGRLKNQQLEQSIVIPQEFVEKHLGQLWMERLVKTGIETYLEGKTTSPSVHFAIADVLKMAKRALEVQELIEKGQDPRSPMH